MKNNNHRWLKLDNAAKVFPCISSITSANVFRIAFILKEEIDNKLLQESLDDCKKRFPTFFVKMRKGLFWYYFEQNERKLEVKKESPIVCSYKNAKVNKGYLFDVFYYKNRISFEVFHSIADALGAMELAKAVVYHYLELKGYSVDDPNNQVIHVDSEIKRLELEDSFNENFTNKKLPRITPKKAYLIKGQKFYVRGLGVISGTMLSSELVGVSKKYNCTITQLISALIMQAIYQYMIQKGISTKKPINIVLPVNMRKYFESETLRNFSLIIYLSQKYQEDLTFNDFLTTIKSSYDEQLNIENLQGTLNANMNLERQFFLKICPLILKQLVLKLGYGAIAGGLATVSLSNIGKINVSDSFSNHIEKIEFVAAGTEPIPSMGIVAINGITTISFTRVMVATDIEKYFFEALAKENVNITIESNLWEDN